MRLQPCQCSSSAWAPIIKPCARPRPTRCGAIGEPAVAPLAKALCAAGREADQHEAPPAWNEGATNMEDAAQALAAVGEPAVEALCELLEDESEWTQVNAAFAPRRDGFARGGSGPGVDAEPRRWLASLGAHWHSSRWAISRKAYQWEALGRMLSGRSPRLAGGSWSPLGAPGPSADQRGDSVRPTRPSCGSVRTPTLQGARRFLRSRGRVRAQCPATDWLAYRERRLRWTICTRSVGTPPSMARDSF